MARLAGLPMYEFEALRPAFDRLWEGLRRAFEAAGLDRVPERLDRSRGPEELWRHPDLLIGQTCGYPFTHALRERVQLVATPCYAAAACAGPDYASLIMARAEDRRRSLADFRANGRLAINHLESHSGHFALRAALAACGAAGRWFIATVLTGSHLGSLEAVQAGKADLAAIDGVIVALLERHAPDRLAGLRVLAVSPSAPGLPLITSAWTSERDLMALRHGLRAALAEPSLARVRAGLLIEAAQVLPREAYRRILELERLGAGIEFPEPA